ncbi:MAG: Hsp20/alpha crystallin family protein [Byssovorax sp.]
MNIVRRQPTNPANVPATTGWDPFQMMREMMRFDPFRELSLFGRNYPEMSFNPDVDVKETPEAYMFTADVPGMKEKDLEVSISGNRLTVSGKREEEKKEETATYYATERSWGSFTRSFTMPAGVDTDKVKADLKEGVLTIAVPKKPDAMPKQIPVGTAKK